MSPNMILAVTWLASSLTIGLVALPLVAGKVPRNHVYGFRTPKTLSSDSIWYPANRFAGRAMYGAAAVSVGCLLITSPGIWLMSTANYAALGAGIVVIPMIVAVIRGFRYLAKL